MAAKARPLEVGEKFGRWIVANDAGTGMHALCTCICGKQKLVIRANLRNGSSSSCGCRVGAPKRLQPNKTHGKSHTPEVLAWQSMIARCTNSRHPQFHLYGKRGITVCDEWKNFDNFFIDMGVRPDGLTLDRVDNNKGYFKENCRWVSHAENCRNTRRSRRWFVSGIAYESLHHASEVIGVSGATIRGWCRGHRTNGRWYPPKENCWSELKYQSAVVLQKAAA